MSPEIQQILGWVAAATAALAIVLVVVKVVHRSVLKWRGSRGAHYIAAIGEMVSRRIVPDRPPKGWANDPEFHRAVAGYRLVVTGDERGFVDELVRHVGVKEVLARRANRPFPVSSRLQAVSSLVDLADSADRDLLRSLASARNHHVRVNAVRGLARIGDTAAVPDILDLATRVEPWEASRIADALVELGPGGTEPIHAWIRSESSRRRASTNTVALATRVIGLIGDPSSEEVLLDLLGSIDEELRLAAASALEHTGGAASIPALTDALDDRSWRVRARAAVALGAMADPPSARAIAALLYDPVWWVRQNAAEALGSVPGGVDHLIVAVQSLDHFAADAALNQLTVSGTLREASARVDSGKATEADRTLVSLASS